MFIACLLVGRELTNMATHEIAANIDGCVGSSKLISTHSLQLECATIILIIAKSASAKRFWVLFLGLPEHPPRGKNTTLIRCPLREFRGEPDGATKNREVSEVNRETQPSPKKMRKPASKQKRIPNSNPRIPSGTLARCATARCQIHG